MNKELFDPPGIVRSADALAELAGRINAEHTEALAAARASLIHARNAGLLLLEAKKQCGHGQWLPWIKNNVRFSERTVQAYMRVAKRWPELEAKAQATADLTIEDGLKILASPNVDEDKEAGQCEPPPRTDRKSRLHYLENKIYEGLSHQAKIGEALAEAKAMLEPIDYKRWLQVEHDLTTQDAQDYIDLAARFKSIQPPGMSEEEFDQRVATINASVDAMNADHDAQTLKELRQLGMTPEEANARLEEMKKRWDDRRDDESDEEADCPHD